MTSGHRPPRPGGSTARSIRGACRCQHAHPADLGHHGDVGAPRAAGEQPRGLVIGLVVTVILGARSRPARPTSTARRLQLRRPHLRLDVLHGDGLPRRARHHRHDVPARLPVSRTEGGHFTPKQHFGFEAAAWYWHFVDVVWLFLFAAIYVSGRGTPLAGWCRPLTPDATSRGGRQRPLRRSENMTGRPSCRPVLLSGSDPTPDGARVPEQQSVSPLYAAGFSRCPRCGKGRCSGTGSSCGDVRPLRSRLPLHRYRRRAGGICHLHPWLCYLGPRALRRVHLRAVCLGARRAVGPGDAAHCARAPAFPQVDAHCPPIPQQGRGRTHRP